ncbi:MAG: hypothetical protein J6V01_06780, partial [Clostridia bacterium]|nr:hypothetical protein [Clostridia bacterium]
HTYDEGHFDWSEFLWLFRVSSVMIGLVSGVVWLIFITVYFLKIRGARATFERASELYEENVLSRPSVGIRRSIRAAAIASGIYFLLLSDVFFDGVNVLPNFLAAAAATVAFVFLGRFSKLKLPGIVASVLLAAISAASWVLSFGFAERWQWSDVQRRPEAWAHFWRYYPLKIAGSLLAAAVSLMILCAFARVVRDHCGYIPSSAGESFASERLSEIRLGLYRRLRVCAVFAALSALASGLLDYVVTLPYGINFSLQSHDPAAYAKYVLTGLLGAWWAVSLILTLTVFVLFLKASSAVVSESDSRYLLE